MRKDSKYFHPREFVGNNIDFRIGSSATLARFKDSQTYILNQLVFNPYHKFSTTATEILLLKYDLCFDCMCEVEQYLLVHMNKPLDQREIIGMSRMRIQYLKETLESVPNVVNPEYFEVWFKQHKLLHSHVEKSLKDTINLGMSPSHIFRALVDTMIKVINHTVFELQELDLIYFSNETPIFNVDELSCYIENENDDCPLFERIVKLQGIRPFNEIIIKDYLAGTHPESNIKHFYNRLDEIGIKYTIF